MIETEYSYCKYDLSNKNVLNFCNNLFTKVSKKKPHTLFDLNHYTMCVGQASQTDMYVDVVSKPVIETIISKYNNFFKNDLYNTASVIVWDLDDTILDRNYKLLNDQLVDVLQSQNYIFDYSVLWSHGTSHHVTKCLDILNRKYNINFDSCIAKKIEEYHKKDTCKNVSYVLKTLNDKFNITSFNFSCLIDDMCENLNNDYYVYVKPSRNTDFYDIIFNKIPQLMKDCTITETQNF